MPETIKTNRIDVVNPNEKRRQHHLQTLAEFTLIADQFLNDNKPINSQAIGSLIGANKYLQYSDEQGSFDPSSYIYKIEQKSPFNSEQLYNESKRNDLKKQFYDIYTLSKNAWRFMKDDRGDMSDRIPGSLRREITQIAGGQLKKLQTYYNDHLYANKDKTTSEELQTLRNQILEELQMIQKKANAYIFADKHVTANHMDQYEKLLREMRHITRDTETRVTGNLVRLVLTKMHPQEFEEYKKQYEEGEGEEIDIQVRNKIVELSNERV